MERIAYIVLLSIICQFGHAQNKVMVSYDKHSIIILEGMHLVKPIDNTCGQYEGDPNPNGEIPMVYNIKIDSLDRHHIRIQANSDFYDCNLTLFTDKGVLSLDMVFNNESAKPIEVYNVADLIYKYKPELITTKTESKEERNEDRSNTNIQYVYDQVNKEDFKLKSSQDLIDFIVTNIISIENYIYVFIVVQNRSGVDYDLSGVVFSQELKARGGKAAQDKRDYLNIVDQIVPSDKKIKNDDFELLVFQLEKFTLTSRNHLVVELNEKQGKRKDQIKINNDVFYRNVRPL